MYLSYPVLLLGLGMCRRRSPKLSLLEHPTGLQVKQISVGVRQISLELFPVQSGNVVGLLKGSGMPNSSITSQLISLPHLHKHTLTELWQQLFKTAPPLRMRKELMLQFLAYRMQEQEFRALSVSGHARLREFAIAIEANSGGHVSHRPAIKPGTRLIRQWKDQVHIVNVEDGNYEYRGARYASLSEIARLITGTRWSGPLFFGLKTKAKAAEAK
jgi:hypothetical protein